MGGEGILVEETSLGNKGVQGTLRNQTSTDFDVTIIKTVLYQHEYRAKQ